MSLIVRALTVALCVAVVEGKSIEENISKLNADSYAERKLAQKELSEWSKKAPKKAIEQLFAYYLRATSPEAQERIYQLLKELVIAEKYGKPKGFVGVLMEEGTKQIGDKLVVVIIVTEIVPKSSADIYGLQKGDVIWRVDATGFERNAFARVQFFEAVTAKRQGDILTIDLLRGEEAIKKELVLGAIPKEIEMLNNRGRRQSLEIEKQRYFDSWLERKLPKEASH